MQQYYQVKLFNEEGFFDSSSILKMLQKKRKHFFVYFPRVINLKQIVSLIDFLDDHQDVKFCIHDKTILQPENETFLGRNLAFYTMLNKKRHHIENVSFHQGSLFGFGANINQEILKLLIDDSLTLAEQKERFLRAKFSISDYESFMKASYEYLKKMGEISKEYDIDILIKNLSLDTIIADLENQKYFEKKNYPLEKINDDLSIVPSLLEKGDFPRTPFELSKFHDNFGVGISLDMEHFRYLVLLSKRYNMQNQQIVDLWDITLNKIEKKFLETNGFVIQKNKPIFFEKELDLYDQIFFLNNKVHLAHLSGSIGPVFLDKKYLKPEEVTNDLLLGLLNSDDIPFACLGKKQLASFDGYDDMFNKRNFKYDASQTLWEKIFKRQYIEDIYLLKEINCNKIVQKMKGFSEKSTQTFQMFNNLTELDLDSD